jgi:hypothetical protein
MDGCCSKKQIYRVETTTGAVLNGECEVTIQYFDSADCTTVWTGDTNAAESPQEVTIVPKDSGAPITITGEDCAGTPLPITGLSGQIVQTVPAPGAVQTVKFCDPVANLKIEFSETLLYSASTEQSIVRIREYNEDTGAWVLRYENLDGTPFVGTLPADLTAQTAQVNVTRTSVLGCAASVPYIMRETSRFDAETGALESEIIEWVDSAGVVYSVAPAGFSLGDCICPSLLAAQRGIQTTW